MHHLLLSLLLHKLCTLYPLPFPCYMYPLHVNLLLHKSLHYLHLVTMYPLLLNLLLYKLLHCLLWCSHVTMYPHTPTADRPYSNVLLSMRNQSIRNHRPFQLQRFARRDQRALFLAWSIFEGAWNFAYSGYMNKRCQYCLEAFTGFSTVKRRNHFKVKVQCSNLAI